MIVVFWFVKCNKGNVFVFSKNSLNIATKEMGEFAGDTGAPAPVSSDPAATVPATDGTVPTGTVPPTGGGTHARPLAKTSLPRSPSSLRSRAKSQPLSASSPVRAAIRSQFHPSEILAECGDEALVPCSPYPGRTGIGARRNDADGSSWSGGQGGQRDDASSLRGRST
jgi:hypothetical protein